MYADLPIKDYLREAASSAAVPGGGSVAAVSAALAAALAEMVAVLTVDRKGFEDVADEMRRVLSRAAVLRQRCIEDIDRDPEAYREVLKALRLPRNNAEQKAERARALQEAMKGAALVPLALADRVREIMELAARVVSQGNPNAVSDGAVAAMMARSAGLAALCNVRINLGAVEDAAFVAGITGRVAELESEIIRQEKKILEQVIF